MIIDPDRVARPASKPATKTPTPPKKPSASDKARATSKPAVQAKPPTPPVVPPVVAPPPKTLPVTGGAPTSNVVNPLPNVAGPWNPAPWGSAMGRFFRGLTPTTGQMQSAMGSSGASLPPPAVAPRPVDVPLRDATLSKNALPIADMSYDDATWRPTMPPTVVGSQAPRYSEANATPSQQQPTAYRWPAPQPRADMSYDDNTWSEGVMQARSQYDADYAKWLASQPAGARAAAAGSGYATGVPDGVDRVWWEQFKAEHGGVDPVTFYKGDLNAALRDRAWGDQFYRTYGRGPSEYDWKASYYDRKYNSGGGGYGGGGGWNSAGGATPGTSPLWGTLFGTYYADPTRAGMSGSGYSDFLQAWASRAGRAPTTDEATRVLTAYQNYLLNRPGSTARPEDLYAFIDRLTAQTPALPPIAYLQLGEY